MKMFNQLSDEDLAEIEAIAKAVEPHMEMNDQKEEPKKEEQKKKPKKKEAKNPESTAEIS